MLIKTKLKIYFGAIFIIAAGVGLYSISNIRVIQRYLEKQLPQAISDVQRASKLDITAQLIRYDDEVLTQSARNYAFLGDKKWKNRYFEFVPKLDARIKEAIDGGNQADVEIFESISEANLVLVKMEEEAISLVDAGQLNKAQLILDSNEYLNQKAIYQKGVEQYLISRGSDFDSATATTTKIIENSRNQLRSLVTYQLMIMVGIITISFAAIAWLLVFIDRNFMRPMDQFKKAAADIIKGDLNTTLEINRNDEIGLFARDFNTMTATLRESLVNIEKKVQERTEQLTRLNKLMVGREIMMIELKKKLATKEGKKL